MTTASQTTVKKSTEDCPIALSDAINDYFAPGHLSMRRRDGVLGLAERWFWETDGDLRLVYLSADASDLADGALDRSRESTLRDWLSNGNPSESGRRALAAIDDNIPFDLVVRRGPSGAGRRKIRLAGVPIFDRQGRFSGYRGIGEEIQDGRNITRPTAGYDELTLADAIESHPVGFTLYDADDRITFWNSAFIALYPGIGDLLSGGAHFEDITRALYKLSTATDAQAEIDCFIDLTRGRPSGQPATMEINLKSGRWILLNSQRTASGGTVCLHTDITERKKAEESLAQSEHRFAMAFQFNPGMTAIAEIENGTLLAVNDNWLKTFGWSREEVIGKSVAELGVWADPVEREQFIEELRIRGKVRDFQSRHCTKTGKTLDVLVAGETIQLEGKPRLLIAGHDISERKRIEDALKQSEARLSGVLDVTPEAVIILDDSLHITSFNGGAERTFGYGAAEVLGSTVDFLIPRHTRGPHSSHMDDFVSSGEQSRNMGGRGRISGQRKDGVEFPAEASITRLEADGEKLFVVLLRDVTEQYEAEQALRAAKEEAEFSNRAKSEFLANMSHELRTPLNAILGFSQVIRDGALGPAGNGKYTGYAQDIYDSGKHLLEIIGDILDLSKIDAGQARADNEDIDLPRLLDSCVTLVRKRAETADVTLTVDYGEALPLLHADRRRIKQIAINLLSNAIKFTPRGGNVRLAAKLSAENELLMTVADTGIGMRQEDIPRIFEPFHQIEDSLTRKHEGTGLGLPLAKKLCELHDASIGIETAPGRGTKVRVRFPATRTI